MLNPSGYIIKLLLITRILCLNIVIIKLLLKNDILAINK